MQRMEQPIIILCANVAVKGADTPIFIGSFIHIPNTGIFIGNTKQSPKMRPIKILNTRVQNLNWSHFRALLRVSDEDARVWYMNEAANENWSVRTLDRNIGTQYYYRLLHSLHFVVHL